MTADERIAMLESELEQYEFLFSLQNERLHQAIAAWREATGRRDVTPDLGALLEWMMDYINVLEANLAMAEYDSVLTSAQMTTIRDEKVAPEATILQEKDTPSACKWEYGPHREPMRPEWKSGCGKIHPKMLSEEWSDLCPYCGRPVSVPGAMEGEE